MKVLIAPTAFKGTLSALEAADALARGAAEALPEAEIVRMPVADGGDGTMEVLVSALDGDLFPMIAMGPLGRPVDATYGWLPGDIAVVELASASGLAHVAPEQRDPMRATTRGTGDLIAAALERRPRRIIVGVGGSATSDGGAGIAEALGVSLTDKNGAAIDPGALGLAALEGIDISRRDRNLEEVDLVVACDVVNPLLGHQGAARVFAPQKGAGPQQVEAIENALNRFADLTLRDLDIWLGDMPRAGAAGGAAGGMHALLGASLEEGFDVIADAIGFGEQLSRADLLIVGEGRLDRQSLSGKAPIAAARMAKRKGKRVWAFAGSIDLDRASLQSEGIEAAVDLTERWGNRALTHAASALRQSAAESVARAFGP
jgi:glycerate kinase